jgi:hypothetical protein
MTYNNRKRSDHSQIEVDDEDASPANFGGREDDFERDQEDEDSLLRPPNRRKSR